MWRILAIIIIIIMIIIMIIIIVIVIMIMIIIIMILILILIMIMITIIIIIVHLYNAHIDFLPQALYKTIPKNYSFTLRNLKTKKKKNLGKYVKI